jgi:hypothetical protein
MIGNMRFFPDFGLPSSFYRSSENELEIQGWLP